ncbi:DUF421 domain-containing protein [Fretibacter rubidus]|uniref:DUF421 domain-containing protein n=1 Tax=Fretibacter rubidus TaxID=570162 RepID=UPI00352A1A7F
MDLPMGLPVDLKDWLFVEPAKVLPIFITVICVYIGLIALTRIGGIRSFSKMSGFDFAVTVSIGSIFAGIVMAEDPSVGQGLITLTIVFAVQLIVATIRQRSNRFETLMSNKARMIMVGDAIQHDQMRKAKISREDLYAKLREANVFHFNQIIAVIAETTGDVSVIHTNNVKDISPDIFKGVIGYERLTQRPKS